MNKLLNQMQGAVRSRTAYSRTVSEIARMPLDVALDLGLDRADARKIARKAVYGR